MKRAVRRKNFYLDDGKIQRARKILGARTQTETIDKALDLVLFRKEILTSLEAVKGRGGVVPLE